MSSKLFFAQNVIQGSEIITKRTPGWILVKNAASKIGNPTYTLTLELDDGTGGLEPIPLIEAPDDMLCADVRPIIDGKTCGVKQITIDSSSGEGAFLYCFDDLKNRSLMDVQVIQDWGLTLNLDDGSAGISLFNDDGIYLARYPVAQFGVYHSFPVHQGIIAACGAIWDGRPYSLEVRAASDLEGNVNTIKNMIVDNGGLFNLTSDLPYAVTATVQENSMVRKFGGLNSQYQPGASYTNINWSKFSWLFSLDQGLSLERYTQLYVGVELQFNGSNNFYNALIARCPDILG